MIRGERFNSITHLVGASLALVGGAVLITLTAMEGQVREIVSVSIYAATLFILYLASTLYHSIPGPAKSVLRIIDHQAIYLLIAGTYTPYALISLGGSTGWWIFGLIWGLALFGIVMDAFPRAGLRILSLLLYLLMGWLCVFALDAFIAAIPPLSFAWLLAGGIFYTSGVVFYVLDNWYPWCHGIWHLFVIAGSACHYVSIMLL